MHKSRGTCLKYLPSDGKSSASLGKSSGGTHLTNGVTWHPLCYISALQHVLDYPIAASQIVLGERGELKKWMLEQPVELKVAQAYSF